MKERCLIFLESVKLLYLYSYRLMLVVFFIFYQVNVLSQFLSSRVGLQFIWHPVKASRWEFFHPVYCLEHEAVGLWRARAEALGSGRLSPGERQSHEAQWALALACSDTSRTGEGGLSGPAGVKPSPLTPSMPPHPKHAPPGMGNSRPSALPTLPASYTHTRP